MENPEIDSQFYNQLIFDEDAKGTQWEKENIFNKWKKLRIRMERKRISHCIEKLILDGS